MAISSGTKLGRYEIRSKIGEGGMGEVYLAHDTKLDRKVALKILPAEVTAKQERMARFVREAKAAAALNHPNIAHVYEIDEANGHHFIAMEFVEGQTLREKIHRDSTDLRKLLRYLQQVAEGLAKAHAAGIVHRDLKPDNIMIARDGYAKILDFGLAKLIEPQVPSSSGHVGLSEVATAMMPQHSLPGTVMGTVGYMSPEQAQGRINEVDHRSDIFAFGCILFEAATGQKAFKGKDVLDSLHNIVHAPTPQIKDINPLAPDELQRIVRRCLAKDPDKRYQSIKDVAIEIDELRQELKGALAVDYGNEEGGSHMTVATITVADGAFKVVTPQRWYRVGRVAWFGDGGGMAVSAQESQSGDWQIWRVSYPEGSARRITNDLHNYGMTSLTLTADSRTLIALQIEGTSSIWVAPEGDAKRARTITSRQNADDGGAGLDWTPDGRLVFTSNVGGGRRIWVMNADGTGQKAMTEIGDEAATPIVSPDGRHIFYGSHRSKNPQVWRMDSDGSRPVQLTDGTGVETFALTPDGHWVVYSLYEPSIWKVPAEGGTPIKVADASAWAVDVSPDGIHLAYAGLHSQTKRLRLTVVRFDDMAPVKTFDLPVTARTLFRWSHDSLTLIYPDVRGGVSNLWQQPLDGGPPTQITDFRGAIIHQFAYSRDGKQLALSRGSSTRDAVLISEGK